MIPNNDNKKFKYIFLSCLVVAVLIILITFFRKERSGIDYKELIKAKDETIKVLQDQRPIFEKHIEELKVFIDDHRQQDSLLITKISTNQLTIKQVDEKLKNIPSRINAIAGNNDSLRIAISNL